MIEVTNLTKRYGQARRRSLVVPRRVGSGVASPGRTAVLGLFSLAIGAVLQHTGGATSLAIGVVFVLPIVAALLPGGWGQRIHDYLPPVAGAMIAQAHQGIDQVLTPWQGFAAFCAWTAVLLATASYLLRRGDA